MPFLLSCSISGTAEGTETQQFLPICKADMQWCVAYFEQVIDVYDMGVAAGLPWHEPYCFDDDYGSPAEFVVETAFWFFVEVRADHPDHPPGVVLTWDEADRLPADGLVSFLPAFFRCAGVYYDRRYDAMIGLVPDGS